MRSRLFTGVLLFCVAACGSDNRTVAVADLITEARRLDLSGRQEAAVARYRQVLDADASSFDAHYGLGRALDLMGRYEDARLHFGRAVELAPESDRDQALRMLGVSWTFVGNADEAAHRFGEVFDRRIAAGNYGGAAEVANELGRVYLELGDTDSAEKWYRQGYDTAAREADRPGWGVDLADLRMAHAEARIAARRGQADEARRLRNRVRMILDKGGNREQEIQFPYLAGYVEFHLGDYPAAIAQLERADQDDPFILLLLAEAHERLGRLERGRDYYGRILVSNSHAINNAFARPVARRKVAASP